MSDDKQARLDELDKIEMREISRIINPAITDEDFERDWAEFMEEKTRRKKS